MAIYSTSYQFTVALKHSHKNELLFDFMPTKSNYLQQWIISILHLWFCLKIQITKGTKITIATNIANTDNDNESEYRIWTTIITYLSTWKSKLSIMQKKKRVEIESKTVSVYKALKYPRNNTHFKKKKRFLFRKFK